MTDVLKNIPGHVEVTPGSNGEPIDLRLVDAILAQLGTDESAAIPILQAVQKEFRYLPREALEHVCAHSDITPSRMAGISTFYGQFRHRPLGRHLIRVCIGTACHVKGAGVVHDAVMRHLNIPEGDDTDVDGLFTVEKVACLGCCTLAPVVQIDTVTYGHLTATTVPRMVSDFLELDRRESRRRHVAVPFSKDGLPEIRIGLGSCCISRGSGRVWETLEETLHDTGIRAVLKRVGCVGMCYQTPLLEIVYPDGRSVLYARVHEDSVRDIILRHFRPEGLLRRIGTTVSRAVDRLFTEEKRPAVERHLITPRDPEVRVFLDKQRHLSTEFCGAIDPTDVDEYQRYGGFETLRRVVTQTTPETVIDEVTRSGLRGRGGAGYPTGLKWSRVRAQTAEKKYLVMNGDEGDPGAFMDRMLLESYPCRIIEGLAIAAFAVGASEGVLYIRAEYPLAVERVNEALRRCDEKGFLGEDILGSGFSLRLRVMEGAGAFVCGEETALLESIMGHRGMPRVRPPYPAVKGLWGLPTLVNNVETYALVPWIVKNGADAFAALGVGRSKGTKVFALAGKIANGGLIEVPMGITIGEIVEEIGGGIAGGKAFKAVQVGGPSGGCIPAALADTHVDFEALLEVGAMMGSGGFVVLDETDCMVDIARYFLAFTQDQSCGKCTFCRVGTRRMLDVLERLCSGKGRKGDIEELEHLAGMIKKGSLCGLGKTSPNPVLTTIRYFRDEYEAHIEGRCPAGRCPALIHYVISDKCIGCTLCSQGCPTGAIAFNPYLKHEIIDEKCVRCGNCHDVCPVDAVEVR
ncbi:MAG TPA: NAD(P)H-dependent oxidoreductase subunit E [Planctomycetota bacterium]|nr:NAD(P)H-dependent oxidoreductase subunit E [Planctomycetota bacterium]